MTEDFTLEDMLKLAGKVKQWFWMDRLYCGRLEDVEIELQKQDTKLYLTVISKGITIFGYYYNKSDTENYKKLGDFYEGIVSRGKEQKRIEEEKKVADAMANVRKVLDGNK